ncbi:polymer-forming cytoskeletal protein [Ectobacillus ponti]|uniref:Polymer-forming cytoskeletal protein n=1 Tax=Ectobacillus ponti TaxID=2961894 RepID=A0AA42BRT6_9BACI|nr:polymer-forming cytoskeletal protein [Ectobacillus ponti]MCP8971322.1 polymer-forming cytoskeletal protein [Ectobacillus ponti]
MRKWRIAWIILFAAVVVLVRPIAGAAAGQWNEMSTVAKGEVVERTVFLTGDTVTVDGTVQGDVYAAGANIIVNGTIEGDLMAAASEVQVNGTVKGNVRAAAQAVEVNGSVEKNVLSFAQSVSLAEGSKILGEVLTFAQDLNLNGDVGKHVQGAVQSVQVNGNIGGDMDWYGVEQLTIASGAKVGGSLHYQSPQEGKIADGTVNGNVQYDVTKEPVQTNTKNSFSGLGVWFSVASTLLLWLVFRFLFKKPAAAVRRALNEAPFQQAGIGAAVLIGLPIASILLMFTVIGIPLSLLAVTAYIVLLCVNKVFIGIWLGHRIIRAKLHPMLKELIGLVILLLVVQIPFVGWLFSLAAALLFLGAVVSSLWKKGTPAVSEQVPM